MSFSESGYFRKNKKGMLRGKDYGTLTMVKDYLLFLNKNGNEITIPLQDIMSVKNFKAVVHIILNDAEYYFFISPYLKTITFSEVFELRRKAKTLASLLNHLLHEEKGWIIFHEGFNYKEVLKPIDVRETPEDPPHIVDSIVILN